MFIKNLYLIVSILGTLPLWADCLLHYKLNNGPHKLSSLIPGRRRGHAGREKGNVFQDRHKQLKYKFLQIWKRSRYGMEAYYRYHHALSLQCTLTIHT